MTKTIFFLQTLLWAIMPTQNPSFNLSLIFSEVKEQRIFTPFPVLSSASSIELAKNPFCDHEVSTKNPKLSSLLTNLIDQDQEYHIKTVVIDAGHGGKDTGCHGAHSREKHIALGIAKKLGTVIEVAYPTIRVIYTRSEDKFVPLHERAAIANRNKADLFISIHCNYIPNASYVHGSETYVMGLHTANENLEVAKRENASILLEENYQKNYDYDPNSTEGHIMLSMFQNAFLDHSILFAEKVENHIHQDASRKSRGVKQAGFLVLRETTMPSVLIEAGFLSNNNDEDFLREDEGQTQIANAIFSAFRAYKNEVEEGPKYAVQTTTPRTTTPVAATNMEPEFRSKSLQQTTKTLSTGHTLNIPISVATSNGAAASHSTYDLPITTPHVNQVNDRQLPNSYATTSKERKIIPETPVNTRSTTSYNDPFATTGVNRRQEIQYCLQLAASPKPLNVNKGTWREVPYLVQVIKEGEYYKYQIRDFASLQDATNLQTQLKSKGFKDAFIVAYQNGIKVSLEQAKRLSGQ